MDWREQDRGEKEGCYSGAERAESAELEMRELRKWRGWRFRGIVEDAEG